jgi:hypothetical protein
MNTNLANIATTGFPPAELYDPLLEQERWIHRLTEESPFLRLTLYLTEQCEAAHRRMTEVYQWAPRILAEQCALGERVAQLEKPGENLKWCIAELQDGENVIRRLNDAASARMEEFERMVSRAQDASHYVPSMPDVGAIVRSLEEGTSAALNPFFRFAAYDYSSLATGFEAYATAVGVAHRALDSSFISIPEREMFVSTDLLAVWTGKEISQSDLKVEPRIIRRRIDLYVYETLDEALTDLAPVLLPAWSGAKQIARYDHPEKIRWACASLRTVSLGVLELLAPDDEVKKWSSRPRDFFNGRPRTITRLRFIARRINAPALSKFMQADIAAICELIDVLHSGIHESVLELDHRQLRYTFRRVESFLCAIIEASL